MLIYPVNRQIMITDGSADPGNHGAIATPRNITPFVRSGGGITMVEANHPRGPLGRGSAEFGYLRTNELQYADLVLELDDAATTGTSAIFELGDPNYDNERIIQHVFASGPVRSITGNCLVGGVQIADAEGDVVMMTVPLRGTGSPTLANL